jgi:hypothetical protein
MNGLLIALLITDVETRYIASLPERQDCYPIIGRKQTNLYYSLFLYCKLMYPDYYIYIRPFPFFKLSNISFSFSAVS